MLILQTRPRPRGNHRVVHIGSFAFSKVSTPEIVIPCSERSRQNLQDLAKLWAGIRAFKITLLHPVVADSNEYLQLGAQSKVCKWRGRGSCSS